MTPLFILQLICCTVTALLALQLAIASMQVRWKAWRYELSRWLLVAVMLLFAIHYFLQMAHGFRAQGADVGAAFNILFYTPVAFAVALAIINLQGTRRTVRRYCRRGAAAYALIALVFATGTGYCRSLHLGSLLYVMLALFVASMAYFILVVRQVTARRQQRLMQESGADLLPYVRFSKTSLTLLCFTAVFLPVAILFNTMLIYIGPVMLLTIVFFIHTFISLGYYITAKEDMEEQQEDALDDGTDTPSGHPADEGSPAASDSLTEERREEIEQALERWCREKRYKDSDATIYSLAASLGCRKSELTEYFNLSEHTNFRTWLSDIRFSEAVRMMQACPDYSIDAVSNECGFSSHSWIYRIFKQKTGMSPSEWRRQQQDRP